MIAITTEYRPLEESQESTIMTTFTFGTVVGTGAAPRSRDIEYKPSLCDIRFIISKRRVLPGDSDASSRNRNVCSIMHICNIDRKLSEWMRVGYAKRRHARLFFA